MRPLHPLLPLFLLLLTSATQLACGEPATNDLGDGLATEAPCTACTADSARVGARVPLVGRDHGVGGDLVVVDDATLALEDFSYDGGGLDVRAVVAATAAGLGDEDQVVLSEDLRRAGGYDGARLTFPLPDGLNVDDVGAFSIWCVPAAVSFGDAVLAP